MGKVAVLYSFSTIFAKQEFYAYRILKEGKEEYVVLNEEVNYDGILIIEADLDSLSRLTKTIMFFFPGQHRPFFRTENKRGYFVKNANIKVANEKSGRMAVEMMSYKFGDIVEDKVVTSISSRWRQKKSGKMLEYIYFDKKHLHNIYKEDV